MTTRLGPHADVGSPLPADFHRLFAAKTLSAMGSQVSRIAVPLLAITALQASPGQVGLLATLGTAAFLLVGLPAGAWVDRIRRRPTMITADIARALLLGSVPIAWWLGSLTLAHLYVAVFLAGVATVFFDVAALSYLPYVVGPGHLVAANSRLATVDAASGMVGQGTGGMLVQALGGQLAIAFDAVSYVWSAGWLIRIRQPEPTSDQTTRRRLLGEIRDGLTFVGRQPMLRAIAIYGALTNLSTQLIQVMLPVLFVTELGYSAGALGLFFAAGGLGIVLGALVGYRIGRYVGDGRVLWLLGVLIAPFGFLIPLAGAPMPIWAATIGWFLTQLKAGVDNVLNVSLRQRLTPRRLLGRMTATMRFMLYGALAIGAALAGLLGEYAGVRVALWVGAIGLATTWIPIVLSPVRTIRTMAEISPEPNRRTD